MPAKSMMASHATGWRDQYRSKGEAALKRSQAPWSPGNANRGRKPRMASDDVGRGRNAVKAVPLARKSPKIIRHRFHGLPVDRDDAVLGDGVDFGQASQGFMHPGLRRAAERVQAKAAQGALAVAAHEKDRLAAAAFTALAQALKTTRKRFDGVGGVSGGHGDQGTLRAIDANEFNNAHFLLLQLEGCANAAASHSWIVCSIIDHVNKFKHNDNPVARSQHSTRNRLGARAIQFAQSSENGENEFSDFCLRNSIQGLRCAPRHLSPLRINRRSRWKCFARRRRILS